MPINDDLTISYKIPQEYRSMCDKKFLEVFRHELYKIYNLSLQDFSSDSVLIDGGTCGWNTAFGMACLKTNKSELFKYYITLDWYDSDLFDEEIRILMEEYKLVLKGTLENFIAQNLNLDISEFTYCSKCGKYFLITDMTRDKELYQTYVDCEAIEEAKYDCYICDECRDKDIEKYPNANTYYRESCEIVDEYTKKILNNNPVCGEN